MEHSGEPVVVRVGDKLYNYQVFYKGDSEKVRFCTEDGRYITSFPSVDEMNGYLFRDWPETINSEIDSILSFREKCSGIIEKGYYYEKGGVEEAEKSENTAMFIKRINILMGELNSYQFGKMVGLNPGTIYNISHGLRSPGVHILKRISERCGVSVDWLLGG